MLIVLAALTLTACGQAPPSAWPGLTPGDGVVYLAATTGAYAINVADGSQKWPYEAKVPQTSLFGSGLAPAKLHAPPAVGEGVVYFGSDEGALFAVDAATGAQKWEFTPSTSTLIPVLNIKEKPTPIFAGPVLVGKRVIFVGALNKIYALNTATHEKPDWEFEAGSPVWGTPLVVSDTIYFGTLGHKLIALDAETGKERWIFDKPTGALAGSPVFDSGMIYAGSFDNHLYAVDAASGNLRWEFDAKNWVWEGPTVVSDTLYFGDVSGNLYALDAATQTLIWPKPFQAGSAIRAAPLYADGVLYVVADGGALYALDAATGTERWPQPFKVPNARFLTTPLMRDGPLLLAPVGTPILLYGLDPANAQVQWQFKPAGK